MVPAADIWLFWSRVMASSMQNTVLTDVGIFLFFFLKDFPMPLFVLEDIRGPLQLFWLMPTRRRSFDAVVI